MHEVFFVELDGRLEHRFALGDERRNRLEQTPGAFIIIARLHPATAQRTTRDRIASAIETAIEQS